jgi:hypothetical protein
MCKIINGLLSSICQYNTIEGKLLPLSNLKAGWNNFDIMKTRHEATFIQQSLNYILYPHGRGEEEDGIKASKGETSIFHHPFGPEHGVAKTIDPPLLRTTWSPEHF